MHPVVYCTHGGKSSTLTCKHCSCMRRCPQQGIRLTLISGPPAPAPETKQSGQQSAQAEATPEWRAFKAGMLVPIPCIIVRRHCCAYTWSGFNPHTLLHQRYFINVTYHPPARPVQVGHEQQQQAAKRKAYGQDMSAPSTRNVRPRGGSGGVSGGGGAVPPHHLSGTLPYLPSTFPPYATTGPAPPSTFQPLFGNFPPPPWHSPAGFLDACRGVHWVSGEGGCNNEACRGQAKCVSSCRGCPDAVPLLDACQGNHFVDGGCENDACRGRKKCIASCRGCPNRPENRRGGCTVM